MIVSRSDDKKYVIIKVPENSPICLIENNWCPDLCGAQLSSEATVNQRHRDTNDAVSMHGLSCADFQDTVESISFKHDEERLRTRSKPKSMTRVCRVAYEVVVSGQNLSATGETAQSVSNSFGHASRQISPSRSRKIPLPALTALRLCFDSSENFFVFIQYLCRKFYSFTYIPLHPFC